MLEWSAAHVFDRADTVEEGICRFEEAADTLEKSIYTLEYRADTLEEPVYVVEKRADAVEESICTGEEQTGALEKWIAKIEKSSVALEETSISRSRTFRLTHTRTLSIGHVAFRLLNGAFEFRFYASTDIRACELDRIRYA